MSRPVLLFVIILSCALPCRAQQTAAAGGVEYTIPEVLVRLEKAQGYHSLYAADIFDHAPRVTPGLAFNAPVEQVLQACFRGLAYKYFIHDKSISIEHLPGPIFLNLYGRVTDTSGRPLADATVMVDRRGFVTDENGWFSIPVYTFISRVTVSNAGYYSQNLLLSNRDRQYLALTPAASGLDEVEVHPFGQATRRQSPEPVFVVKGSGMGEVPSADVLDGLAARVPGLFDAQVNGVPGSARQVLLGGRHSIFNGNEPLYILDGVPLAAGGFLDPIGTGSAQGPGGASVLNFISPNDIDNISVLKDALATATYGSRASNGVILINLKTGAPRARPDWSADVNAGAGAAVRTSPMLTTQQFLQLRSEAVTNDGELVDSLTVPEKYAPWDSTRQGDFRRLATGARAFIANANLKFSGGSPGAWFLVSGNEHRESTVFPGSNSDEKRSVYGHLQLKPAGGKISVAVSALYCWEGNHLPVADYTGYDRLAPDAPAFYNNAGQPQWGAPPLSLVNIPALGHNAYAGNVYTLFAHLRVSYRLDSHISLEESLGFNGIMTGEQATQPIAGQDPFYNPTGSITTANNQYTSVISETLGRWRGGMGSGELQGLLGVDWQAQHAIYTSQLMTGYTSDLLLGSVTGAAQVVPMDNKLYYRYAAVFGRVYYNFADRWQLMASWRRDGSSRFGPGDQYGDFWAVGGGYIFLQDDPGKERRFLSFGKIRGSYGTTGNDQIGDFKYAETYGPTPPSRGYQGQQGVVPVTLANSHLRWELNYRWEAALELGFLHDHILFSSAVYRSWTANQVVVATVAPAAGLPGVLSNQPIEVVNRGVEFTLETNGLRVGRFSWSSAATLTIPVNLLARWPGIDNTPYATSYVVSHSLSVTKGFHLTGVDPATGLYTFSTANTNGIPGAQDEVPNEGTDPRWYAGWSNSIRFGHWELDFLLDLRRQNGVNPLVLLAQDNPPGMQAIGQLSNGPVEWLDHWRAKGDHALQQLLTAGGNSAAVNTLYEYIESDAWAVDASFIRLKSANLSYRLDGGAVRRVGLHECRIYLCGQDLLTWKKFPVADPETQDPRVLPPLRVVSAGVKTNF